MTALLIMCVIKFYTTYQVDHIEARIDALFQTFRQGLVRPDIKQREFEKIQKLIDQLPQDQKFTFQETLDKAKLQKKYLDQIQKLVQEDLTEIDLTKCTHPLTLKKEAKCHDVLSLVEVKDWPLKDQGTQCLDQVCQELKDQWQAIQVVRAGMINFATLTEESNFIETLPFVLDQTKDLESNIKALEHLPRIKTIKEEYQALCDQVIKRLHHHVDALKERPELVKALFDVDGLKSLMEGTSLDLRPKIAMTFDDGPNPEFTVQVLDLLKKYDVKATFFMVGSYIERYPELAKRISEDGHYLGNHSYSHPDYSKLSDQEILSEIDQTQQIIKQVTGKECQYYRMPYGVGGKRVYQLLPNLTSITWNTDTGDWYLTEPTAIFEQIMSQLSDDMIVLLHDTNQNSVDVLAKLLPELKERGYDFVGPTEVKFDFRY